MERRINRISTGVKLGLGLCCVLALLACDNTFNIYEAVTTKVMVAANKFLLVESVSPTRNANEVEPSSDIYITFDRDIDETTADTESIIVAPALTYDKTYYAATRTLVLSPIGAFEGGIYTIQLTKGIRGKDSSTFQNDFTWSFHTDALPGGSIKINEGVNFINDLSFDIYVTANSYAKSFKHTINASLADSGAWNSITQEPISVTLSGPDGVQNIYYQFAGDNFTYSAELSATVTLDRVPPFVEAGTNVVTNAMIAKNATAFDDRSGIALYAWSGTGVSFSAPTQKETKIWVKSDEKSDETYTVSLYVEDRAGNHTSDSFTLRWDTIPPNSPIVTSSAAVTTDRKPTWTWTSGGGGIDAYRFQLDGEDIRGWITTESTSITPKIDLAFGSHTLFVQEKDDAGNWSSSGSFTVLILRSIPTFTPPIIIPTPTPTFITPTYSPPIIRT